MTTKKATPAAGGPQPGPLTLRMARAIIDDTTGKYGEEERARVREALEHRPADLSRVLDEVYQAHGEGGR